jgi:MoaA/NifB/PqqE/SkfB family radical SAM enzyme
MSFKRVAFVGANKALSLLPGRVRKGALAALSRLPFDSRRPRFLAIEPTNSCNLKCPLCPVGAGTMDRKLGFMDVGKYHGLIDEISGHASRLLMNFAGEPLLHPHIGEMVAYAESRGLAITLGTHGNIDKMQELVDAGLTEILFSLDGTTEEVYRHYRVGGSFKAAYANLEKLLAARRATGSQSPRIILQFVVMRHNRHQVREIVEVGRRLGVDLVSLQPVCVNDFFEQDQDTLMADWVPEDAAYLLHPEVATGREKYRPPLCVWAIQSVVLYNGDVTVCCFDTSGGHVVGNAFEPGGFAAVWDSGTYRAARQRVVLQELDICRKCDIGLTKPTRFPPGKSPVS